MAVGRTSLWVAEAVAAALRQRNLAVAVVSAAAVAVCHQWPCRLRASPKIPMAVGRTSLWVAEAAAALRQRNLAVALVSAQAVAV
jgi:molybdopterin-guanine dinucleotide biosynthesis protein